MTPKCLLRTCSEANCAGRDLEDLGLVAALKSEHSNWGVRGKREKLKE